MIQIMRASACLTFVLIFSILELNAQNRPLAPVSILYKKEASYGILFHTRGFGGSFQFAHHAGNAEKYRLFDVNLYSLKDPKEVSMQNPLLPESRPYVYGKLNSLILLKANYGYRWILADKTTPESVRVNYN